MSHSSLSEWIEINMMVLHCYHHDVSLFIEWVDWNTTDYCQYLNGEVSLFIEWVDWNNGIPTRKEVESVSLFIEWVDWNNDDINIDVNLHDSLTLHWVSGLKYSNAPSVCRLLESHSSLSEWIEISVLIEWRKVMSVSLFIEWVDWNDLALIFK